MSGARFQRTVEDFECENCHRRVAGDGYTNHCPACLFSKHVDVAPGDRLAACSGLMRPLAVLGGRKGYVIVHRCERCDLVRRNRSAPGDDVHELLRYAGRPLLEPRAARSARRRRPAST
jgi:hypothetical protein